MAVMLPGLAHARPWRPAHVVVVIEENYGYEQIIGNPDAAFINKLAADGALLTNSHGIQHPSQPNYLALFSGSTQGVIDESVPGTATRPNLGGADRRVKSPAMARFEAMGRLARDWGISAQA